MAAVGNARDVTVPDIGDFIDVPVIEILVEAGQHVAAEDPLVVLESDKATMEVPAPFAGVVAELKVKLGDRVSEGATLLVLDVAGESDATEPPPEPAIRAAEPARRRGGLAAQRGVGDRCRGPVRRALAAATAAARADTGRGSGLRVARRAPARARARHRSRDGAGQRPQGPDHEGGPRAWRRAAPAAAAAGRAPAGGRGRARGAHPHPAALARRARALVADDPARHPERGRRHHRARGVPQAAQRRAVRREGDDGRAAAEGVLGDARRVPALRLLAGRRRARASSASAISASPPTRPTASSSR